MSSLNWGFELWDKISTVEDYSSTEINQLENLRRYLTDYAQLCLDFGQKQRELVDRYIPRGKNKGQPATPLSTTVSCFHDVVRIFGEVGGSYEALGNEISKDVAKSLKDLQKKQAEELKKQTKAKTDMLNVLKKSEMILESTKQRCQAAYRDMIAAKEYAERCNSDMTLARNQVMKATQTAGLKSQEFERMQKEYASKLNDYNQALTKYHYQELPFWCGTMEIMDVVRSAKVVDCLNQVITSQRATLASVSSSMQKMDEAVGHVDVEKNSEILVINNSTKEWIPGGKELVDFASHYGSFPGPNSLLFTREQVEARMLICRKELDRREKDFASIEKLKGTYSDKQGAEDCANQERRLQREMNSLKNIMSRLEKEYQSVAGLRNNIKTESPDHNSLNTLSSAPDVHRSGSQADAMSESDTDDFTDDEHVNDSVQPSDVPTPEYAIPSNSSSISAPHPEYQGYCTVHFPFAPTPEQLAANQGLLEVRQGEQLYVKSHDENWSYLHSQDETRQGFVPTNYLEITVYSTALS